MDAVTRQSPPSPVRLAEAFHWLDQERVSCPTEPLDVLIDRAVARFALSASQRIWISWTLQPTHVAVASKEPLPAT